MHRYQAIAVDRAPPGGEAMDRSPGLEKVPIVLLRRVPIARRGSV
jgi:hypothetical protein